ncbi:MAG: hypothetical protein RL095_611 [Verrucomicrobiota bacterium]|jgi:uncharacterized protein (DUF779 family)
MAERVSATPAALEFIAFLAAKHGPLMFHQSGGCCDGSAPNCFLRGEFQTGPADVLLGEIGGAPFYIGARQYETWKHTHLVIDVVPGQGGAFSLDGPEGRTFLSRSRLFTPEEAAELGGSGDAAPCHLR